MHDIENDEVAPLPQEHNPSRVASVRKRERPTRQHLPDVPVWLLETVRYDVLGEGDEQFAPRASDRPLPEHPVSLPVADETVSAPLESMYTIVRPRWMRSTLRSDGS